MAYEEDDEENFDYGSLPDGQQQEFLYELIGFKENALDNEARDLFYDVMYNNELSMGERLDAYNELTIYLYDEYGLVFEEIWDWDAFREWYG
jgi:hypothetical protein